MIMMTMQRFVVSLMDILWCCGLKPSLLRGNTNVLLLIHNYTERDLTGGKPTGLVARKIPGCLVLLWSLNFICYSELRYSMRHEHVCADGQYFRHLERRWRQYTNGDSDQQWRPSTHERSNNRESNPRILGLVPTTLAWNDRLLCRVLEFRDVRRVSWSDVARFGLPDRKHDDGH